MQTENEKAILDAVAGCPGASAGEIARHLGMDRSNVRRDAKRLVRNGVLVGQNDGGTLRFYLADAIQSYAPTLSNSGPGAATQEPVDVDYREIPVASSDSRALVVYGAAQPADNRMAGTLAAADKARRRQGQVAVPGGFTAVLNELFATDPDGVAAIAELQQQMAERLRAATAHEQWVREQYARERAEVAAREEKEKKQREADEIHASVRRLLGLDKPLQETKRHSEPAAEPEPPLVHHWRQRQEAEKAAAPVRIGRIAELLARGKAAALAKEEPPSAGWTQWLSARLGAPKKAVWR